MKKMDIHNLTAKDIKKLHIWLRALIQVLYFLFIPSVYTAAFAGVKYIFTQIGAGEKVAVTSFVTVLVVISEDSFADSLVRSVHWEMVCMHSMCGFVKR